MSRALPLLILALLSRSVPAATCTWGGGGADAHWSTASNWTCDGGHVLPVSGDALVFPAGASRLTNTNDIASLTLGHLQFDGLNYVIGGNALGVSNGVTTNVAAGGKLDKGPRLALDVSLATKDQLFESNGDLGLLLIGALDLGGHQLLVDGTGPLAIAGDIGGAGGITKNGTGNLVLSGAANSYTGSTILNDGTTSARSDLALGASGLGNDTVVSSGATLLVGAGTSLSENLSLPGGNGFGGAGALASEPGDSEVSGNIFVGNNQPTVANAHAGTTLTLSGVLSGLGTLNVTGAGRVRLTNIETHPATRVVNGLLEVAGQTTGVTADLGGVLTGTGISSGITLNFGGAVAPGGRPGTLDSGPMTWNGNGALSIELGPSAASSDRLALSGALVKGTAGTYNVSFGDAATPPVPGVTYTLVTFTSTTFSIGDFTFDYAGTGAGASMTGDFGLSADALTFTPTTVTSDLVFRDGLEPH
jgi:fibronectin-binding autotransporter adhesin